MENPHMKKVATVGSFRHSLIFSATLSKDFGHIQLSSNLLMIIYFFTNIIVFYMLTNEFYTNSKIPSEVI